MFEVIKGTETIYTGNDWIRALVMYEDAASQDQHVILWEGEEPAREYHPELGYLN